MTRQNSSQTIQRVERKQQIRVYHFFPDVFFSVTFAVVHHGSTWLTKTTYSQHQNVRKATHYDHKTLAFPIRMINQNHTPRRRLIFQHQRKILLDHVASIGNRYSHTTNTELTAETKTRNRSCANNDSYLISYKTGETTNY